MIQCAKNAIDFVKARRESGLSDETMMILLVLYDGQPRSKDLLSRETEINPTTIPRYVAGLIAAGHVERERCEADRRSVRFVLNEKGVKLVDSLLKYFPADNG